MREERPIEPNPTETLSVGYPGRDGAHSAAACDRLFPTAELVALPSFHAVVDATAAGDVAFGVLPIESSLSGPVAETHDLLYDAPLSIVREASLPIRHCLVARRPGPVEQFTTIRSHPVAFEQCRRVVSQLSAKLVGTVVPTTSVTKRTSGCSTRHARMVSSTADFVAAYAPSA